MIGVLIGVAVALAWLAGLALAWALCRAAGDADRRAEDIARRTSLPSTGGYCGACGRTMHTQTRILVAHKPEADHIYCMWCGVRLAIVPDNMLSVKVTHSAHVAANPPKGE